MNNEEELDGEPIVGIMNSQSTLIMEIRHRNKNKSDNELATGQKV